MNYRDGNSVGLWKRLTSRCRLNHDDLVVDEEEHMLGFTQFRMLTSMTEIREGKVSAFPVALDSFLMVSCTFFHITQKRFGLMSSRWLKMA